jgi:hypothetical protein
MSKDCNSDLNYFDADCDYHSSNKTTPAFSKRKDFCNRSRENAYNTNCIRFCNVARTECTLKKMYDECKRFGISDTDCTQSQIDTIRKRCLDYKMISDTDRQTRGAPQCNASGLASFESDCNRFNIALKECDVEAVNDAKETEELIRQEEQNTEMLDAISEQAIQFTTVQSDTVRQLYIDSQNILQKVILESEEIPSDDSYKLILSACIIIIFIGFVIASVFFSRSKR